MGKKGTKYKTQRNLPLYGAALLLCLTLCSTYLVSGLYARYASSGQGSDGARVAKFSIAAAIGRENGSSQSIEAALQPGETMANPTIIEISNDSEVAVEYGITVSNETNNLPLIFSLEKRGEAADVTARGSSFTAQRLPGSHWDQYELSISWPQGEKDPDKYMGKVDSIAVTVTAAQID